MNNMKLSLREKVAYGCGDFSYALIYAFLTTFIMVYLTNVAHLSNTAAGMLVLIANVFDAVNDPMVGFIADRRKPSKKWGRYRGWIATFCAPSSMFIVLCFFVPQISMTGRIIYAYATYLIWTVLKTCVQVPYAAMSTAITLDSNERSALGAVRDWGNNIGGLVISFGAVNLVGHFGSDNPTGYRISIACLALLSCAGYLFTAFGTKERVTDDVLTHEHEEEASKTEQYSFLETLKAIFKNRYAVALILFSTMGLLIISIRMNLTAYFCMEYLGDYELKALGVLLSFLYIFPVIGELFVPLLTKRIGKRITMMVGACCYIMVGILTLIARQNTTLIYVAGAFIGIGSCFTLCVVWGAIPDASDYGELKFGISVPGMLCSFVTLAMGCGTGIAGTITSGILNLVGYNAALEVQAEGVGTGLYLAFGLVPIILGAIMLLAGFSYTLTANKMDEIHRLIGEREGMTVADAEASADQ